MQGVSFFFIIIFEGRTVSAGRKTEEKNVYQCSDIVTHIYYTFIPMRVTWMGFRGGVGCGVWVVVWVVVFVGGQFQQVEKTENKPTKFSYDFYQCTSIYRDFFNVSL